MENKKRFGIITGVVTLVVAIVGATIAFATYNASLVIKGSGTVKGAKWSIIFDNLVTTNNTGNSAGQTPTARQVTAPTIEQTDKQEISTFAVELRTPGDYITYTFDIVNDGDFPAKIANSYSAPTKSCAPATGSTISQEAATAICNKISITLKYTDSGTDLAAAQTLPKYVSNSTDNVKNVTLKIQYAADVTTSQLPTDDVKITINDITIPFVQD